MVNKNGNHIMIDYINSITDKESPILKTIGYYLNDQSCVEELDEYFNSRLSILGFIIIVLTNLLLIGEIVFIIFSYYHLFFKMILIVVNLLIDRILIQKYKNFISLSYSYRLIYLSIQNIPLEILKKTYYHIMKNTDFSH